MSRLIPDLIEHATIETMEMVLAPVLIAAFSMGEPGALQARKLWPSLLLMIMGITLTGVGASGHSADGTSDWAHRAEEMACAASALGSWPKVYGDSS
ncbi:MAG: hypothetical protein ABF665_04495 [Gluconacetobacter sp.]